MTIMMIIALIFKILLLIIMTMMIMMMMMMTVRKACPTQCHTGCWTRCPMSTFFLHSTSSRPGQLDKIHDVRCPMSSFRLTSPQYKCKYNYIYKYKKLNTRYMICSVQCPACDLLLPTLHHNFAALLVCDQISERRL